MTKLRNILLVLAGIPVLLLLLWVIVVPVDLIKEKLESAAAGTAGNMSLSVNGLRKGIFFTLSADNMDLKLNNTPVLKISDFTGHFSPRYLAGRKLGFDIMGKIGSGDVKGILKLPLEGSIKTEQAELSEIPYLKRFDIDINGHVSSDISIKDNSVNIIFNIQDLKIDDSASLIPMLNTFSKLQGALSVRKNTIQVDSISLEGEKGYARLKGSITDNIMALTLELMPAAGKLNTLESMAIGKYIVSPGYYVVPISGPLPRWGQVD